jgi:HEAT repeat protein
MSNDNHDDLPALPNVPDSDDALASASATVAGLDDEAAARKIRTRTSWVGRVMGVVLVGGSAGLGYFAWQRNVAYEHRWDEYNAAQAEPSAGGAQDEADFNRRMREALPSTTFQDVQLVILGEMGEHRDAEAVPLLVRALDSAGPIRAQAARALARIGLPAAGSAKPDLMRVLPSCTDPPSRAAVVWALAVLNEPQAADAIVEEFGAGHLQGQHGFDPRIIVTVLGVQRLAGMTRHEQVGVRALVAQALSEAGTPDVIDPLTELLRDEDDQVRRQSASGLGRIGDPRAAGPLFAAMQSNPNMRVQVLEALRRSTGARGLAVLLQSASDDATKRDLAIMIRGTHDPAGADALASLLTSTDDVAKLEAASGLAELGDARGVPVLLEIARGTELGRARDALDMLALVQSPEVPEVLGDMVGDETYLARRAGMLKALGRSGAPEAGRVLVRELEGDDIATAAMALAELGYEPAYDQLLRMVPRPRDTPFNQHAGMAGVALETAYQNRTAAVRALGRDGRPEAAEALMTIVEDAEDDPRLRNDAGLALGAVATDEILGQVIDKIQATDLDDAARRYYLGALWQHPSRPIATRLLDIMANQTLSGDIRIPAAVAVGYAADPANDARLVQMLGSPETDDAAAIAICLGGSEEAAQALLARLGQDADLRLAIQELLMNQTNDWFNLVTGGLWDSGQVYRRLRVAEILNHGDGDNRHGYAWTTFVARLQAGWGGHDGLSTNQVRRRLYADLTGSDASLRPLIVRVLAATGDMGLLMAARDANGPGAEEARRTLMELNRPPSDDEAQAALGGVSAH